MPRNLDTDTLRGAAEHYTAEFNKPSVAHPGNPEKFVAGRSYVMQDLHNLTFKDEFEFIVSMMRDLLSPDQQKDFDRFAAERFTPRDDTIFEELLAKKLAVNIEGEHIPGLIGTTIVDTRVIGKRVKKVLLRKPVNWAQRMAGIKGEVVGERQVLKNAYWNIYAGENEERLAGNPNLDLLPDTVEGLPVGANNPRISNECAILACDAIVDNLDEGTGAAVIQGRTGTQPSDPDTAASGTLLFTLVCSDPAFGGAVDDTGKATATASSITDDSSADATGTLGYCRISSTNDGATPLDDHIDGEAGTSGADFNFNTVSITSGSTVSMTSLTLSVPES